ncbi:hypothetical protein CR513_19727, partial [Mucuna pruriens]
MIRSEGMGFDSGDNSPKGTQHGQLVDRLRRLELPLFHGNDVWTTWKGTLRSVAFLRSSGFIQLRWLWRIKL